MQVLVDIYYYLDHEKCKTSCVLCNILSVAIELSRRFYITSSCDVARNICKSMWFSFKDAAGELSRLGFDDQPIHDAVRKHRHTLVDAYLLTDEPIPHNIRGIMLRSISVPEVIQ